MIGAVIQVHENRRYAGVKRQNALAAYIVQENGCWEWLGTVSPPGYGHVRIEGKSVCAHRFVYEQRFGRIPEGLTLDHLCRNRLCVRPEHLEPVTLRENILRGNSIVAQLARQTHCKRGHPLSGPEADVYVHHRERECRKCRRILRRGSP